MNTAFLLSTISTNIGTLDRVKSANASLRELEDLVDQLITEEEGGEEEGGKEKEKEKDRVKEKKKDKGKQRKR